MQDISYKKALLKKIAYHHWIDLNRKRGNEVISNEQQEESYLSSSSENRQEAITYLFDRLTAKQTVIYLLKEVFLFQIKEIAEIMKSSETAVKASLHRSKKNLGNKELLIYIEISFSGLSAARKSNCATITLAL